MPQRLIVNRRRFLATSGSAFATLAMPAISRANDRPLITHGVQSGDVGANSGMIWSRTDRPARMQIEIASTDSFSNVKHGVFVDALPETDFTAKALIEDLPAGQDIFYRIRFQDLSSPTVTSEPVVGRFRTAPSDSRPVSFVWSGDTCGQGWGIDESRGGFLTYSTMQKNRPDFLLHSGDAIYADYPLAQEIKLANGEVWRNLVTEEKAKHAETLDEYRANYKYNLRDKNLLAFNAEIPTLAQWDDHEVTNNWWPAEKLVRDEHKKRGYVSANAMLLQARGTRAFHEYMPVRTFSAEPGRIYRKGSYGPLLDVFLIDMRSYRGSNEGAGQDEAYGPASHFLGPQQVEWLKRELAASRATWKVIAADMPLALVRVYDAKLKGLEGVAQGDGPARGRELEFADILSFAKRQGVRNMVWLTADVHYTAAHYFDPGKAVFQDFDPFWEFVSGPILAGTGVPGAIDNTFGPQQVFVKGSNSTLGGNLSPTYGMQFFGLVEIGSDGVMTVSLKDVGDNLLWSRKLEPVKT